MQLYGDDDGYMTHIKDSLKGGNSEARSSALARAETPKTRNITSTMGLMKIYVLYNTEFGTNKIITT